MVVENLPQKFSKTDCYNVIREKLSSEDFTILNYEENGFGEMNGYLGDHSTLKIEIEHKHQKDVFTFFMKSLPQVQSQKNFLEEINGYFKEKQFFTKYLSDLKKFSINILEDAVPKCYTINETTFIFEDLSTKGYETLSSRIPLKFDCIKAALITLAKLHASGLILEELKCFRLIDEFEEELRETFYRGTGSMKQAVNASKCGIKAVIDLALTEDVKISKELFVKKACEDIDHQQIFAKPSVKFRNTVCHADAWTKNFMFKFEEGKEVSCVIVDFQTYRYGPPAQDVLSFIYLVTDRNTRDKHLDELLLFYYNELRSNFEKFNLKEVVSLEEFFESCNYFKQFALIQNITHFQVVILSDEIANELFANPEYVQAVLFRDKRYEFIVDTCQRDSLFKERHFELIDELREYYEEKIIT